MLSAIAMLTIQAALNGDFEEVQVRNARPSAVARKITPLLNTSAVRVVPDDSHGSILLLGNTVDREQVKSILSMFDL